jgi:hypothetical protein
MERIRRLDTWARLGYAARGVVYMLLGWIALSTGRGLTTGETVEAVDRFPGGTPLLVLLALGLFGYGAFKIYASVLDLYHKGSDAKGRAERGAYVAAGLAYLALAFVAVRQAWSHGGAAQAGRALGSGGAKQEVAEKVAASSGGGMLLALAGVIILGIAAVQFYMAWKARFLADMAGPPPWVKPAGQFGYAARAVIVAIIGYYAVKAGLEGDRIRDFGDALATVHASHRMLFKAIAAGLILFGLVSLTMARFGRIPDEDVVSRVKANIPSSHA